MVITNTIKKENLLLWETMKINSNRFTVVHVLAARIKGNRVRYEAMSGVLKSKYPKSNVPWSFLGLVHYMECNLKFTLHLHNGDPLTRRTVRVPIGRPVKGNPPFSWEQSALDAMQYTGLHLERDWSIENTLFRLEGYNGYGYRTLKQPINSPYLWSYTNHYKKGKFIADHKYSPNAVSEQCGVAPILKELWE